MNRITRLIRSEPLAHEVGGRTVRTVNPPLHRCSTVLFDTHDDMRRIEAGQYEGLTYGTHRVPVQRAFEAEMAALEGMDLARAFPSGISAIIHVLMAFTQSGDHVLVCDNVYGPTARFCDKVLSRYGVTTEYIPPDCGENIREFIRPETRLIFLESPGSNTFELQDLRAIADFARSENILTVLDNTWATPLYLDAASLNMDITVHSATKYITGHSDVLMGTAAASGETARQLARFYDLMEVFAPAEDCYQALKGLKTMSLRLKQHEAGALLVARALEAMPVVDQVLHPALPSHPQHELWKRDYTGSSGLFSFLFQENITDAQVSRFVDALDLFGLGFSWGGYKSLITAGPQRRRFPVAWEKNGGESGRKPDRPVIRLHIGLEDPEDLLADLTQAMEKMGA